MSRRKAVNIDVFKALELANENKWNAAAVVRKIGNMTDDLAK